MHTHSAAATARPRLVIALMLSATVFVVEAVAAAVAAGGLASNAISTALLREAQSASLTVRAAYLEVLSDLLGSGAVAVSAIVTLATGLRNADTVAAFAIVALIVPRGWRLLREAIDVLLEATPRGVDLDVLRTHIRGCAGVTDAHDLPVWTITTGLNVVSAHVVVERHADPAAVLDSLGGCLPGAFDIEHPTFQLGREDRPRIERSAHP